MKIGRGSHLSKLGMSISNVCDQVDEHEERVCIPATATATKPITKTSRTGQKWLVMMRDRWPIKLHTPLNRPDG